MYRNKIKASFAALCATSMLFSGTALAQEHEHELEHGDHAEIFEQVRAEQNNFFEQMRQDIENGIPVDIASGQCKYISSIFQPPPAKTVALTFDDGPSSSLTPKVLDLLKKYQIKGTFFMKGNAARANLAIVKRVRDEGHIVASHSYSHPDFHKISAGTQASEVTTTDSVLKAYMPKGLKLFRYPYGNSTCETNALSRKIGYRGIVGWHVDSCDWAYAKHGYVTQKQADICGVRRENIANFVGHVMSEVRRRNGGVLLMHEVHANTVSSLEEIIVRLSREGYKFRNLDSPSMAGFLK